MPQSTSITTIDRSARPNFLIPVMQFALAMLRAALNDLRGTIVQMITPLFLLGLFWLTTRGGERGDQLMTFMFPSLIGLTVMLAGQPLAIRVVNWRQQGIFQRLAATPAPLGHLVLGAALAQLAISLIQCAVMMGLGLALGLKIEPLGALMAVGVLTLGAAGFISYGALLSGFSAKAETVSALFTFTLMPVYFLGGGFPPEILPEFVRAIAPYLPTTMLTTLLNGLINAGHLPENALMSLAGLAVYTFIFAGVTTKTFRWE